MTTQSFFCYLQTNKVFLLKKELFEFFKRIGQYKLVKVSIELIWSKVSVGK